MAAYLDFKKKSFFWFEGGRKKRGGGDRGDVRYPREKGERGGGLHLCCYLKGAPADLKKER